MPLPVSLKSCRSRPSPAIRSSLCRQGIGAPRDMPAAIVEKLNKEINAGLADPKLKARFADLGATVSVGSPADFGKFIADETEKWAKVIKFADAKAE
jgi:tripartite-type tricarboxylate transporter receptor subunit TctC